MPDTEFKDIEIEKVDKEKTYKPDPNGSLYNVYFQLSAKPTNEWCMAFDAERKFPRHNMWRQAWIEGKYVVVCCVIDEIEKYHLKDIKEDVVKANSKYKAYLSQQADKRMAEKQRQEKEQKEKNKNLDNLRF
jgi:hypothetical protein